MKRTIHLLMILSLLLCSSCRLPRRRYQTPEVPLPVAYTQYQGDDHSVTDHNLARWWTLFADLQLNRLVDQLLSANQDYLIALEKIQELRFLYQLKQADLFPKIDLQSRVGRRQLSQNIQEPFVQGDRTQNFYRINLDALWEIDLFGKLGLEREIALNRYQTQIEIARGIRISLIAEMITTYIQICFLNDQMAIIQEEITLARENVDLSRIRERSGLGDLLEVEIQERNQQEIQGEIYPIEQALKRALFTLAFLVGQEPGAIATIFRFPERFPTIEHPLPHTLPAELLRQRPDIRRVERELAEQNAQVGAALADFFPRISLEALLGFDSSRFAHWLVDKSRFWSWSPTLNQPLLYFGRLRAQLRAHQSVEKQTLIHYEQTILRALTEVEGDLVTYYKYREQLQTAHQEMAAATKSRILSEDLYEGGFANLTFSLEARYAELQARKDLVEAQQMFSLSLVALYKSLGGGWSCS